MKVPKIIHQTWKTKEIPQGLLFCAESWKRLNPGWEYRLWTDEEMDAFVKKYFPEIHEVYVAYPHGIFRADLFRLLVVYQMGGVYADLDMECIKSLDYVFEQYIRDAELTLTYEHPIQVKELYGIFGLSSVIHSIFLAGKPGNEILDGIIKTIVKKGAKHDKYSVIGVTGPFIITKCLKNVSHDNKVVILDYKIAAPIVDITSPLLSLSAKRESLRMLLRKEFYPETCMVHYWWHGWTSNPISAISLSRTKLEQLYKDSEVFQRV